ncbi:MAG: hypothetical protein Ta2E_02150 [Mycoplasmoidaceae bacterium]|nr:MAG: hypothetical protein Ta2E_02150 [Mycoplasmoidaceae bacterium]
MAICNHRILKDFFETVCIENAAYLFLVVRNKYKTSKQSTYSDDYKKPVVFLTLCINLLKGLLFLNIS